MWALEEDIHTVVNAMNTRALMAPTLQAATDATLHTLQIIWHSFAHVRTIVDSKCDRHSDLPGFDENNCARAGDSFVRCGIERLSSKRLRFMNVRPFQMAHASLYYDCKWEPNLFSLIFIPYY